MRNTNKGKRIDQSLKPIKIYSMNFKDNSRCMQSGSYKDMSN